MLCRSKYISMCSSSDLQEITPLIAIIISTVSIHTFILMEKTEVPLFLSPLWPNRYTLKHYSKHLYLPNDINLISDIFVHLLITELFQS